MRTQSRHASGQRVRFHRAQRFWIRVWILVWILAVAITCATAGLVADIHAAQKRRVIVLTDFFKDPDDKQSMVRFLTYANELEVEGLIATSLAYGTGEVHPGWIEDIIDEYGQVLGNLRKHERPSLKYPSVDELKNVVKEGAHVIRKLRGRNKGFAVSERPRVKFPRPTQP